MVMLIDLFLDRYYEKQIKQHYDDRDKRFFRAVFELLSTEVFPYFDYEGKVIEKNKIVWKNLNSQVAKELGEDSLSPVAYSYYAPSNSGQRQVSGTYAYHIVCEKFVCAEPKIDENHDKFIKERLSFVEYAFRKRQGQIDLATYVSENKFRNVQGASGKNNQLSNLFAAQIKELNARLKKSGHCLQYHNGFLQISNDELIEETIESPFWNLVSEPEWKNVDEDMKTACDLRDKAGRDPSFYAAKALESAIKIISDKNQWTHGGEKGAANYIDNLGSKNNGKFISDWERDCLKDFFSNVRNPFGHGAGSDEMPKLSTYQTDWAIEFCMSWIKSLISRL